MTIMTLTKSHTKLILASLLFCSYGFAQAEETCNVANNAIYLELGGNAGIYSINYERFFDNDWGLRLGIGGFAADGDSAVIAPLMVEKLWGNPDSPHKFETGLGIAFASTQHNNYYHHHSYRNTSSVIGTATLGYRYMPQTRGMLFKAGFTPLFGPGGFLPWAGLSVGYAF